MRLDRTRQNVDLPAHKDAHRLVFRGDVEGLRAVAVLLVVAVHYGVPWLTGGFVGVDVFFVISGFLITGLLVSETLHTGHIHFADFYLRRLRRLLPALLTMLVAISACAAYLLPPADQHAHASAAIAAAFWTSNIYFALVNFDYFAPGTDTNLFLHTWSLGVEEQFYLVWPTLLTWLVSAKQNLTMAKQGLWLVAATSFVACLALNQQHPQYAFYMMPLRAWQFAVGGLVWLYTQHPSRALADTKFGKVAPILGWTGMAFVIGAGVLFDSGIPYPGLAAAVPTIGAACILGCGSMNPHAGLPRLLSWRPLQALGRISYPWYLWHWPALLLGRAILGSNLPIGDIAACAVSLVVAILTERCIERPVRGQDFWMLRKPVGYCTAFSLMALVSMTALAWSRRTDDPTFSLQRYRQARYEIPEVYSMGCVADTTGARADICTFGSPNAAHTIILMGDSIAAQWQPAALKALAGKDWRLLVITKGNCPMVDGDLSFENRRFTECTAWHTSAIAQVRAIKPDIVLISSYWDYNATQAQWWIGGTRSVLRALTPAANHVYLLRSTPRLPFDGTMCPIIQLRLGRATSTCSAPYLSVEEARVFGWLREAASTFPNVSLIDMNDLVCPIDRCDAERNGMVVFRDFRHLTPRFSASLGAALAVRLLIDNASTGNAPSTVVEHAATTSHQ